MMNRRQFVTTGAAGVALFGRVRGARAAAYDLIIKGGRVVDPSMGVDDVRDVAIMQAKIAAVAREGRRCACRMASPAGSPPAPAAPTISIKPQPSPVARRRSAASW